MKETGIIMSGDHPVKILDGTKTMTRRTYGLEKINDMPYLWGQPHYDEEVGMWLFWQQYTGDCIHIKCPYGHIGDLLWVREHWSLHRVPNEWRVYFFGGSFIVVNDEDVHKLNSQHSSGRPSIHLPRWASRIERIITGLRPERLQEITEEDALGEGITIMQGTWQPIEKDGVTGKLKALGEPQPYTARYHYEALWDSINGKRYPWSGNWWVWVISFLIISSQSKWD